MLGMETVAERLADYVAGHHPAMPGILIISGPM
jgi:hypothetical protein